MRLYHAGWSLGWMLGVPAIVLLIGVVSPMWLGIAVGAERFGMDPGTYGAWRHNHPRFAKAAIADGDGGYHILPMYDPRYPSSAGLTVAAARAEMTKRVREHMFGQGSLKQTRTIRPPDAEVEALAMALPAMEVGQYGYLHSVEVVEVLGAEDMVVEGAWLLDPGRLREDRRADERRAAEAGDRDAADALYVQRDALEERQSERDFKAEFRLTGFKTEGLERRDRWGGPDGKGLQVALVDYEQYGSERRPRWRLVARPASDFGARVSEAQFVELLEQRGLTPTQFVELYQEAFLETRDRDEADRTVFKRLLPADPRAEAE